MRFLRKNIQFVPVVNSFSYFTFSSSILHAELKVCFLPPIERSNKGGKKKRHTYMQH